MITKCPVCRKQFDILWPHLYKYKINKSYFCSWTCYRLRQRKKEDEMNKPKQPRPRMTSDEMATDMQIWRDGGDIDTYLKEHGIGNIQKWKANARARKPEEAPKPKTAGDAMIAMKEAADNFFSQCEDMGLKLDTPKPIDGGEREKMETPESNKLKVAVIGKPETAGELKRKTRYTVTAIKYPEIGEFYYDRKYSRLFTTITGSPSSPWKTKPRTEVGRS